jgi:hypothetical protein
VVQKYEWRCTERRIYSGEGPSRKTLANSMVKDESKDGDGCDQFMVTRQPLSDDKAIILW